MKRSRNLATALTLAIMLGACDSDATSVEAPDDHASDELATLLASAPGTANSRGGGGGPALFERLNAEISGFAGLYRTGRCALVVVLTDLSDADDAIRVVHAAVEPLVERSCPDGVSVRAERGQYSYGELQRFLLAASELRRIDGVLAAWIDYRSNTILVTVSSREVIRPVLDALPSLGIPEDAVSFKGGSGQAPPGGSGRS